MKKSAFLLFFALTHLGALSTKHEFLLALHPAYESRGGRVIYGDFERDLARQWATALRMALSEKLPTLRIISTDQLAHAGDPIAFINQINRMGVDLLVSFNLFEAQGYPQLFLYRMSYANTISESSLKSYSTILWSKRTETIFFSTAISTILPISPLKTSFS